MDQEALLADVRRKICREIDIAPEGVDRYIVYTPFTFDDGDHFAVLLCRTESGWFITDDGHTLMHLSYSGADLSTVARAKTIEESLASHCVENRDGELRIDVPGEGFGDALYSYLQALSRVATVAQRTTKRTASPFPQDFRNLLSDIVPEERREFEWHDPHHDPDKNYTVDCRINGSTRPCFVFAVGSTRKCNHATITCLTFERWHVGFRSVVLFEDQMRVGRHPLAQLTDIVGKQFSSLGERDRIAEYFRRDILSAG